MLHMKSVGYIHSMEGLGTSEILLSKCISDYTSIVQLENIVCVKVTGTGNLTGFVYWFTLHFPNGETIGTGIQGSEVSKKGILIPH